METDTTFEPETTDVTRNILEDSGQGSSPWTIQECPEEEEAAAEKEEEEEEDKSDEEEEDEEESGSDDRDSSEEERIEDSVC